LTKPLRLIHTYPVAFAHHSEYAKRDMEANDEISRSQPCFAQADNSGMFQTQRPLIFPTNVALNGRVFVSNQYLFPIDGDTAE
ncbi:MAG TPA: hypothetical protein VEK84_15235, partial [Terriglobales bacterium]|nr:hypothetical protein [Terriglobales bacterium]